MSQEQAGNRLDECFRALVTATSDVVYSMSADWSEMRHLVGRDFIADTTEPSRGWLEKYIPRDDQPRVLETIAHAVRTKGVFELEHRVLRPDGTLGWTLSRAIPILDERGEIVEWFGAAGDVTRRKQAEAALAEARSDADWQHRLYEAILGNTPDLVYVWNLDHRFIYANEALLKMWGQTRDEAIGKNCLELGYEPWHAALHDREIEQVVATGKPIRGEVPFSGTLGRSIYDYILVPVGRTDGTVVAVAGTTRDVTDYRDIQQRKDEFIAMLSHELRNPLAPLRTALHLLRAGASGIDPAPVHAVMERQVEHLVRLVDDLMEVSRISRGALELRKEPVDIASVARNALETSAPNIRAGEHRLTVSMPGEPLWVEADPVRLAQVLANLLNNAAHYTPRAGAIALEAVREGAVAVVRVRDDGAGIPPERLPTIFEMFTRGDGAQARLERPRHRACARPRPGADARRHDRCAERGSRARQRVHRSRAAHRAASACSARPRHGGGARRTPHPRHRRQPRCRGNPCPGAEDTRRRSARGGQRQSGARRVQRLPARGGASRHRDARHGRVRGGPAHQGRRVRVPHIARGAHRLGTGRAPPEGARGRFRPPPGEARRDPCAASAARFASAAPLSLSRQRYGWPPSTIKVAPVTYDASSEASHRIG